MDGITEHHGSEKCMVELEFTVEYVLMLNKLAKLLNLENHKEVINLAISHFSECEESPLKRVGQGRRRYHYED